MMKPGLYEQLINKEIEEKLKKLQEHAIIHKQELDKAEAPGVFADYLRKTIEKYLENYTEIQDQVTFVNGLIAQIYEQNQKEKTQKENAQNEKNNLSLPNPPMQLMSYYDKMNNSPLKLEDIIRPETSLSQSSLFTGAVHEPQMASELKKEIASADRIDMLVSFIKWSGLRLIIEELKKFTERGGKLRVVTTSYMGATDVKAVEELHKLRNTSIKISYDTKRTRLHAKAYVFYRETDYTTAYVGSSNLSNAAISSGLEWNVKVTKQDLDYTIRKIEATFESYWNSYEFSDFDSSEKLKNALIQEKNRDGYAKTDFVFDIYPYPYQQEILDQIHAERYVRGNFKNLIVAATGTGKTVISAFDYKNFLKNHKESTGRLLFIAHREEILKQSLETFRGVLKDNNFGELFVGGYEPKELGHLFLSVQTFQSKKFTKLTTEDFYDYIIIDEFHHAAAQSYQQILSYYKPKVLLGLTATPERMDGKSILTYFDDVMTAQIRLPEAIDRKLLCPFQYFGVTDQVDLKDMKWSRGGYEKSALSNLYTMDGYGATKRANLVIDATQKYVTDMDEVKGLGFCVSVRHAEFMANHFNAKGIPSIYLTGETKNEERKNAKNQLVSGEVKFIFVVDLYNEGVDIPEINTILFLRPTESLTIFLQQLGRGLRLSEGKECLTVLDFIGQAHQKYNFEEKFASLLSGGQGSLVKEIKNDFVSVPKGCAIQLEKIAKEYVLENVAAFFKGQYISKIASFTEDTGQELTLENFVNHYHLDVRSIYKKNNKNSFSRLCVKAKVASDFDEELESILTNAFSRVSSINSAKWINFLLKTLNNIHHIKLHELSEEELRMLQMFQFTIWKNSYEECGFENILEGMKKIKQSPRMYQELVALLSLNLKKIDFVEENVEVGFDTPLCAYSSYTRDQILVAMDFMKPNTVREGVKYLEDKKVDLFFVTLHKSDKDYSPTTMYKDYSINDKLFHWQSQSTTGDTSKTGTRYINHEATGNHILLFVREFKEDMAGTAPYTFLGKVNYVEHEGEKPMNIIWEMEKPIPAKYLKTTNQLIG